MTNPLIFSSNSFYFFALKTYGYQIRRLNNMVITMEMKREKEMKKFERFKKTTKCNKSKMARYINTTR